MFYRLLNTNRLISSCLCSRIFLGVILSPKVSQLLVSKPSQAWAWPWILTAQPEESTNGCVRRAYIYFHQFLQILRWIERVLFSLLFPMYPDLIRPLHINTNSVFKEIWNISAVPRLVEKHAIGQNWFDWQYLMTTALHPGIHGLLYKWI